jgi:biopolymer transport protein ExbD
MVGVTLGACSLPHSDPPVLPSNDLAIQADATVLWNGAKVDPETLNRLFKDVAQRNPQPEIHVKPDRLAKYDAVARIIASIIASTQGTGATHVGFTGIDTGQ